MPIGAAASRELGSRPVRQAGREAGKGALGRVLARPGASRGVGTTLTNPIPRPRQRHLQILFRGNRGSGACKINAHCLSRAPRTSCGREDICFWQGKFRAAPPTPRGDNADGNGADPFLQNKRSFLSRAAGTLLSALYNGGWGGPRETPAVEKEISATRAEILCCKNGMSVYFASTGSSRRLIISEGFVGLRGCSL